MVGMTRGSLRFFNYSSSFQNNIAFHKNFSKDGNQNLFHITKRFLNVTEYHGMNILKRHGVKVPLNMLAKSSEEAEEISRKILDSSDSKKLIIKAQVLAGGRGKGTFLNTSFSGVEVATSPSEVKTFAKGMIGNVLKTKQTTSGGILCNEVLVAEKLDLVKERYLAFMLDRQSGGILAIATKHGGGNVEEIAEKDPSAVLKWPICPLTGITADDIDKIVKHLDFSSKLDAQAKEIVSNLFKAFVKSDALLLEINPIAETSDEKILACDSKVTVDDNAKYRQTEIFEKSPANLTHEEAEADKVGLNYISLDGNVACIVNGAGLAMATLDLIQYHGGAPANFLDVGGNSTGAMLSKALDIVNNDPNAKVLLVNIVGGIVHCDKFATSFIEASKRLEKQLPVVIRLQGTRADIAKRLLNESNIPHLFCLDFDSAAKSAVEIAKSA
ncbi:succinyl-CoA synthetase beta chain, putative [Theileria equi strain WA]|uniref:Succinate--CoA ligase [ADP-forming] subunit beta, mitochondrial n=1 Tax=Theileria equi strain WA TaxID=1537102 RepID=L1LEB7_THEEQ|nr:succinyl-CoA synthetase beta chain, putative [Theileria equi strain WA]EKX73747.1 succinyl-CoA synthetase beta chain, putative [Theileria equi strain WA]|eukprot:XP_004833199.1 succinyl-CoA synthetase beta chain, putative [Theileria equi strain WA]